MNGKVNWAQRNRAAKNKVILLAKTLVASIKTSPLALDELPPERPSGEGGVATKWWFWTAIGGVAAVGVTAIVLAQDVEPSTVLVGVRW